jgi:hypothetical protein
MVKLFSMTYALDPEGSVPREVRRVAIRQLTNAIDGLTGQTELGQEGGPRRPQTMQEAAGAAAPDPPELPAKVYRAENDALRDAARQLSPVRDAWVLLGVLDSLTADGLGSPALRRLPGSPRPGAHRPPPPGLRRRCGGRRGVVPGRRRRAGTGLEATGPGPGRTPRLAALRRQARRLRPPSRAPLESRRLSGLASIRTRRENRGAVRSAEADGPSKGAAKRLVYEQPLVAPQEEQT